MEDGFRFTDDLGPEKVVHIYQPSVGLRAVLVVDNVAAGPSIGGVRMAPDATTEECFRLARAMTLKNAAAGLAHGGGKSVIVADPKMAALEKERVVRAFARAVGDIADYIPGPDMGTDETCMAWVRDEIGRAVGLPPELGGIPLDTLGATGFGCAVAVDVAREHCGLEMQGARVAIQGFGSVGMHAARFLCRRGAVLVAAADSRGTLVDPNGIDVDALIELKSSGASVTQYGSGETIGRDAVLDVDCEIWIPAARPDVITADNVDRVKAKLIVQGANIPVTPAAEKSLHERGVLSIPDFIANAGGVICAAVEYHGGTRAAAFETIEEQIGTNVGAILKESADEGMLPREAALAMATARVRRAMEYRRWK
jgi:glutamate dehydrogenase (NAD(P)+)